MDSSQPALLQQLHWYGHDTFRLDRPMVVYLDPWRLAPGAPPADLILVTHHHHDHCSPEDIAAIRRPATRVVANASAAAKLSPPVNVVSPGDRLMVGDVAIEAVPAYKETPQSCRRSPNCGRPPRCGRPSRCGRPFAAD